MSFFILRKILEKFLGLVSFKSVLAFFAECPMAFVNQRRNSGLSHFYKIYRTQNLSIFLSWPGKSLARFDSAPSLRVLNHHGKEDTIHTEKNVTDLSVSLYKSSLTDSYVNISEITM